MNIFSILWDKLHLFCMHHEVAQILRYLDFASINKMFNFEIVLMKCEEE